MAYAQQGPLFLVLPDLNVRGGNFTYDSPTFNLGGTYKITNYPNCMAAGVRALRFRMSAGSRAAPALRASM
jgi:hypothetical protein